jgi:hypothetical protein
LAAQLDTAFATWFKANAGKTKEDWRKTLAQLALQSRKVTYASEKAAYEALALNQAAISPLGGEHHF